MNMESFIIGGISGGFAKLVVSPIDRIKIIYQASLTEKFTIKDSLYKCYLIYKKEGMLGFWRGCSASMIRLIPYDGIKFSTYSYINNHITNNKALAGSIAGMLGEIATYPLETIRTKISYRIGHNIGYKDINARTLYRGICPAIISTMSYNGVSFGIFNSDIDSIFIKGILSGIIGTMISYPFDIVKRRRQVCIPANIIDIYKNEGIEALYKGVTINLFKSPIVITISFGLYKNVANMYTDEEKF